METNIDTMHDDDRAASTASCQYLGYRYKPAS